MSSNHKGYIRIHHNGRPRMEHDVVWELANGPIPDGHEIHHKDFNRANNVIENLECLTKLDHKRLHSGCYKNEKGEWIKPCRKCQAHKLLETGFYKAVHGGPLSWCKTCMKANHMRLNPSKGKKNAKRCNTTETTEQQPGRDSNPQAI